MRKIIKRTEKLLCQNSPKSKVISFKFFKTKFVQEKQYECRSVLLLLFFDKQFLPILSLSVSSLDELFSNHQNLQFIIRVYLTHLQHIFSEQASSTKDSLLGEFRRKHRHQTNTPSLFFLLYHHLLHYFCA